MLLRKITFCRMSNWKPSPSPHGRSSHHQQSSNSIDRQTDYHPLSVSSYRGRSSDHYPSETSAAVPEVGTRYNDSVFIDHRRVNNGWRNNNPQIGRDQRGNRPISHHHHYHDTYHYTPNYNNSGGDPIPYGGSRYQDSSEGRLKSNHHHQQNDGRSWHRRPHGHSYAGSGTNDCHPNFGISIRCDQSFDKSNFLHPIIHDDDPSTITTRSNTRSSVDCNHTQNRDTKHREKTEKLPKQNEINIRYLYPSTYVGTHEEAESWSKK